MTLFTQAGKDYLASQIDSIHEAFKRDIVIIKEPNRTIISTNPSFNYNYDVAQQEPDNVAYVPVSGVFQARVKWLDIESRFSVLQSEIPPQELRNRCRLKLTKEGYEFIKDSKEVIIDGKNTLLEQKQDRPHGLFTPQYYTVYLTETN